MEKASNGARWASAAALLLLLAPPTARGASPAEPPPGDRPVSGGRLIWDLGDELDLLGDLWVRLPLWRATESTGALLRLDARTAIERAASDFTFDVRDLEYTLELGWRARVSAGSRNRYSAFVGQRGVERVDADGQPWVRYAGVGFEHGDLLDPSDPRRERRRLDWSLFAAPVFEDREVEGDFVVRAGARCWLLRRTHGPLLAFDARMDGLLEGGRLDADLVGGPRLAFFLDRGGDRGYDAATGGGHGGGPVASFTLHYQRGRHPLGIGHSAWLLGFEYSGGGGSLRRDPPDVSGTLAAGGGEDGRLAGELLLRVLSPPFAGRYRASIVVDGNLLTAEDTGELYYTYDVGLEHGADARTVGAYFHHRSNHVLAEPNDTVTSINVLEAGVESPDWKRPGRRPPLERWGRLDYRARAGYLLDSAFGEDQRWHLRGGVRWRLPRSGPWQPFLELEAEAGDVQRTLYAVGVSPSAGLDLQLELRDDDQYYGEDRDALLLTARYGF